MGWVYKIVQIMATADVVPLFSDTTLESARKAKVSTENFYENLLIQDRDRTNRLPYWDWFNVV